MSKLRSVSIAIDVIRIALLLILLAVVTEYYQRHG